MSDVVVWGATPAGVVAAVAAARAGARVLLVGPEDHVGGLLSSGLHTAEAEHMLPQSFSGLPLEFYRRVGAAYGRYVPLFHWESHVAERVFDQMLRESGVDVLRGQELVEVHRRGARITALELAHGTQLVAAVYVDASYEGDLMARAGVPYALGRESSEQYGESLAGVRFNDDPAEVESYSGVREADEPVPVAPYGEDGRLLPGFVELDGLAPGSGDRKTMSYHFRITVSTADDRLPIGPPPGYDRNRFATLARYLEQHPETVLADLIDLYPFPSGRYAILADGRTEPLPGTKWEVNNRQSAVISLGHFGGQFGYVEASAQERARVVADHREHNQGLLHFLATDPSVPPGVRAEMQRYGLPADEYADNGHWPYLLYVREARRMVGRHVMTQADVQVDRAKDDAVAVGSHWIDSHHVQRVAVSRTHFRNEGRIWVAVDQPYHVPLRSILPPEGACPNLVVPVCASASHVAFCSIRVETTWMALGQAAGTAAAEAVAAGQDVVDVEPARVQRRLRAAGVLHLDPEDVLTPPSPAGTPVTEDREPTFAR